MGEEWACFYRGGLSRRRGKHSKIIDERIDSLVKNEGGRAGKEESDTMIMQAVCVVVPGFIDAHVPTRAEPIGN